MVIVGLITGGEGDGVGEGGVGSGTLWTLGTGQGGDGGELGGVGGSCCRAASTISHITLPFTTNGTVY